MLAHMECFSIFIDFGVFCVQPQILQVRLVLYLGLYCIFGIVVGQDLVRLLLDKNNGVRPPIRVCGISDSGGGIFSPIGLPLAPLLGLELSLQTTCGVNAA